MDQVSCADLTSLNGEQGQENAMPIDKYYQPIDGLQATRGPSGSQNFLAEVATERIYHCVGIKSLNLQMAEMKKEISDLKNELGRQNSMLRMLLGDRDTLAFRQVISTVVVR